MLYVPLYSTQQGAERASLTPPDFAETVTTEQLLDADCTSCRVTQDKSSYWHPAMYFQDGDSGEFELVPQVGGMLA